MAYNIDRMFEAGTKNNTQRKTQTIFTRGY